MNRFSNQQIISGFVSALFMTYAAFFVWIAESIGELRTALYSGRDRLDQKFSRKIESLSEYRVWKPRCINPGSNRKSQ
jgi:hypothetical protein